MRISETKVVQLIEGFDKEGPTEKVVVVDEKTGEEIVFTPAEIRNFQGAISYFFNQSM